MTFSETRTKSHYYSVDNNLNQLIRIGCCKNVDKLFELRRT